MFRILVALMLTLALVPNAFGALPSAPFYCEHQGYTYDPRSRECVFDDGVRCDADAFLKNSGVYTGPYWDNLPVCGSEYVRQIPCRKENETVFYFEECCKGLKPHLKGYAQPSCVPEHFAVVSEPSHMSATPIMDVVFSFLDKIESWIRSVFRAGA